MKPRYIDANVILPMLTGKANTMEDKHGVKLGEPWLLSYDDIKEVIDKIPTANFKNNEIPRGEWEKPFEFFGKFYHKCNNCHISSDLILIDNFCPNCGAKMNMEGANDAGARVVK